MDYACIEFSRLTRSAVAGCVLNKLAKLNPDKGLTINIWAAEGLTSMGMRCDEASSFRSALARPRGLPQSRAPVASA